MANLTSPAEVSDTLSASLGDLIAAVGRGLAEAQQRLDLSTIETIKALYAGNDPALNLMRELGWQPAWYRIPELAAEITLSLTIDRSTTEQGQLAGGGRVNLYASPVDATYTNRYDYRLEAASVIKFKIVPVPPPAQLADRRVAPALVGLKYGEARRLLARMGIASTPETGNATDEWEVSASEPAAGELLLPDESILLRFHNTGAAGGAALGGAPR